MNRPKKRLGQHFLKDNTVIQRILDALEAKSEERFLEIGPGPATLSKPFHDRGFTLTVVECDPDMTSYMHEQDFQPPINIIQADFLEVDLDELIPATTKVFSNLPYNVSVPITARLLAYAHHIPLMVLMYQKEVAERIRAGAGRKEYGIISVLCALFYQIDWYINVKPGAFYPPPKVMSQVIRLRRREQPLLALEHLGHLTELLRTLFQQRRKMISSSLKKWRGGWSTRETLLESLKDQGLATTQRPESVSVADYVGWFKKAKGVP